MATKVFSSTTSSRDQVKASPGDVSNPLDDLDYLPMVLASAQAALITFVGHFAVSAYLAMQWGAEVRVRFWFGVVPHFAFYADVATYYRIVKWSVLVTGVLLGLFSLWAFAGRSGLRVQAGRLFAWIDIALLGAMQLYRHYSSERYIQESTWMWAMVLIGVVGFAVGSYVVSLDVGDRRADLIDRQRAWAGDQRVLLSATSKGQRCDDD